MGFQDMAILIYAAPHAFLSEESPIPHIGYLRLCDDIKYRDGEELAELYAEAVREDSDFIDPKADRLYWKHDNLADLGKLLHDDFNHISSRSADYEHVIHPGDRYVGFHV
ncbi:hypothetical protein BH09ACT10_BH09ACT10_03910 [soil metagenome]